MTKFEEHHHVMASRGRLFQEEWRMRSIGNTRRKPRSREIDVKTENSTDRWVGYSLWGGKKLDLTELTYAGYDMSGLVDIEMNQTNTVYFTAQRSQEDFWEKVTMAVSWRVNRNCYKRGHILPAGLSVPSQCWLSVTRLRHEKQLPVARPKGERLFGEGLFEGTGDVPGSGAGVCAKGGGPQSFIRM